MRPPALPRARRKAKARQGSYLIEFALAITLMVMLTCGVAAVGINLDRYLAVLHLAQYSADVYRSNARLEVAEVRNILLKGTRGMGITAGSGQGVIYLSKIQLASAGSNAGSAVITHRTTIGAASVGPSRIGNPTSVDADGHVGNYETSSSARATLPSGVALVAGQELYAAEVVESGAGSAFPGWIQVSRMRSTYFY